jgi:mannosyltransferase OCH1-like enzyme
MIPRIIHQVWEGKTEPVPPFLSKLATTWKENHPEWQYEFWDEERMNGFVRENFTDLIDLYFSYSYSVQRWDAIRYFILYKIGGLYVDLDYECLAPFDDIIAERSVVFLLIRKNRLSCSTES